MGIPSGGKVGDVLIVEEASIGRESRGNRAPSTTTPPNPPPPPLTPPTPHSPPPPPQNIPPTHPNAPPSTSYHLLPPPLPPPPTPPPTPSTLPHTARSIPPLYPHSNTNPPLPRAVLLPPPHPLPSPPSLPPPPPPRPSHHHPPQKRLGDRPRSKPSPPFPVPGLFPRPPPPPPPPPPLLPPPPGKGTDLSHTEDWIAEPAKIAPRRRAARDLHLARSPFRLGPTASGSSSMVAKHAGFQERFAQLAANWASSSNAFTLAVALHPSLAATGPFFSFSDTWQLVINTSTTIITFLMVFLIQRSQNKDGLAIQLKLDELVAALKGASNRLINIEDLSEEEVTALRGSSTRNVRRSPVSAEEPDCSLSIDAATTVKQAANEVASGRTRRSGWQIRRHRRVRSASSARSWRGRQRRAPGPTRLRLQTSSGERFGNIRSLA